MSTTLTPQRSKPPAPPRQMDEPNGLRRWNVDEYHRMSEMDIFDGAPVELLGGDIWQVHTSDYYRWTPEQYHRLIEAGFFDDRRVEMLGGLFWDMTGQMTPHATGVRLATLTLEEAFSEGYEVRPQLPIVLPDGTEPEPDVAIAPGTPLDYLKYHPRAEELLLAVEISDSSLTKDRGLKLVSYAQAWITEYWIVNLINRQLEVYRNPIPSGTYTDFHIYLPGEVVIPISLPTKAIAVADLLPPVD
jgi:Uma2 family endonuclease